MKLFVKLPLVAREMHPNDAPPPVTFVHVALEAIRALYPNTKKEWYRGANHYSHTNTTHVDVGGLDTFHVDMPVEDVMRDIDAVSDRNVKPAMHSVYIRQRDIREV